MLLYQDTYPEETIKVSWDIRIALMKYEMHHFHSQFYNIEGFQGVECLFLPSVQWGSVERFLATSLVLKDTPLFMVFSVHFDPLKLAISGALSAQLLLMCYELYSVSGHQASTLVPLIPSPLE